MIKTFSSAIVLWLCATFAFARGTPESKYTRALTASAQKGYPTSQLSPRITPVIPRPEKSKTTKTSAKVKGGAKAQDEPPSLTGVPFGHKTRKALWFRGGALGGAQGAKRAVTVTMLASNLTMAAQKGFPCPGAKLSGSRSPSVPKTSAIPTSSALSRDEPDSQVYTRATEAAQRGVPVAPSNVPATATQAALHLRGGADAAAISTNVIKAISGLILIPAARDVIAPGTPLMPGDKELFDIMSAKSDVAAKVIWRGWGTAWLLYSGMKLMAVSSGDIKYLKLACAGNALVALIFGSSINGLKKEGGDITPFFALFAIEAIALGVQFGFDFGRV
jgi:hypothetical protein